MTKSYVSVNVLKIKVQEAEGNSRWKRKFYVLVQFCDADVALTIFTRKDPRFLGISPLTQGSQTWLLRYSDIF
jgi:hypothetical protein